VVFVYRHCVCAVCGTLWCGFGGVSVQQVALCCLYIGIVCVCCVWESLVWVWGSECAAGGFVVFLYRHCVCVCVWDSLVRVWGSECAAGGFVVFVYRPCVCAVCGTVWCGFGGVSVQ